LCDLSITNKIPKVVIGCRDPFKEVDGKGIEKLKAAGIEVVTGVMEAECKGLNKRFFTFHTGQRPYIILKWAQTEDGFMAPSKPPPPGEASQQPGTRRLLISNEYSNRLVHKWRSEEASILIGTNTALLDDPELNTRLWPGNSPVRLVVDMNLRLPASLKLFNREVKTIILNSIKQEEKGNLFYYKLEKNKSLVPQLLSALYQSKIQSVIVEGGAKLLQSFIDEGIWDEMRIISSAALEIGSGLVAPRPENAILVHNEEILTDTIEIYQHINPDPVYGR
jgi:diaminohydroxyphosphoribosylaminopyrimidine deaminase / 5-amino-6-(5-phosphoribosylamino)uracil reductase